MDDRPVHAPGLDVTETDDGLVVLNPANGRVCHLNPSAAVVFELSDGERDVPELAAAVARLFDLPTPPLDDVVGVVARLRTEGLLV